MTTGPRIRISLSQQADEIKGTIELPGDPSFTLEALQIVIERVSVQYCVPADAVVRDLYSLIMKNVK